MNICKYIQLGGFSGGLAVKNLPADAGKMGSISVLAIPHAMEQLSPSATTTEAWAPRAHAPQQEKPVKSDTLTLQWRVALDCCNQGKTTHSSKDPLQPKIKTNNNKKSSTKY